ncbi:tripartite tricarboxylate transporter TctB family protein [Halovulum sp. GXIMD14794]
MKFNDAILGGVFVIVSLLILLEARTFPTLPDQPLGPGTFPTIIAGVMLLGGAGLILSGLRHRAPALAIADWMRTPGGLRRMLAVPLFVVAYILLSKPVGFPIVVPALLLLMLLNNGVRPVNALLTAAGASLAIWLLFAKLLMVPLPLGILTEVIY